VVAIVDDDLFVRRATSSLVRSLGWTADTYESAEAFLRSDARSSVGCLICDIRMEGMDGVTLFERLKRDGWQRPTVFITAFASDPLRAQVLELGALCLIEKPIDVQDLESWLARALASN